MTGSRVTIAELPSRPFVSWGAIAAVAGLVGLTAGVLAWVTGTAGATNGRPTATGDPSATATTTSVLPSQYADAPRMTDSAWRELDASWDVLVVSYPGRTYAPDPRGSYALYLTPPAGERRIAFAHADLPDAMVRALAWDPVTQMLLLATDGGEFRVATMRSGAYVDLDGPVHGAVSASEGLGRASDGLNYVSLTIDEGGETRSALATWDGRGWHSYADNGFTRMSPLRGDVLIADTSAGLVAYNVVTGEQSAPAGALRECSFVSWANQTEYTARCPNPSGYDDIFGVGFDGQARYLGPEGDVDALYLEPAVLMTGTPVTLGAVAGGDALAIGVLTPAGVRSVGTATNLAQDPRVRLVEGNRWILDSQTGFPIIIDAARGTLTDSGIGFGESTAEPVFLPGAQG